MTIPKIGDRVQLERRWSTINGWSIREGLDGAWGEVVEIDKLPEQNPGITVRLDEEWGGSNVLVFKDAIGSAIPHLPGM